MQRAGSSNTYTFVYMALRPEIKRNMQPYVCQCADCEFAKYTKFMRYMENKEPENKENILPEKKSTHKILLKRKSEAIL